MSIFDALLEILIILGYLNKILSTSSGSGVLKTDQKHRTQKAAEKANELYCYSCETMDINHNYCMNVSQRDIELHSKCEENKRICTVKRVSFLSSQDNTTVMGHKTWSLSRSCSDKCQPGCIVIGERNKIFVCWTCCETSFCNNGTGKANMIKPNLFPVPIIIFKMLCQFISA